MYLKTDKENAKLNSQCEKDGTISPSPQDTFREDSISVLSFLLACIIFHWRVQRKPESLLLFLIFFFFFSMWHKFFFYYYYFPANVKAVPISLVCFWHLAVINNASHWITSFIYSASVISLISSPPSPVYLSLTLRVPNTLYLSQRYIFLFRHKSFLLASLSIHNSLAK